MQIRKFLAAILEISQLFLGILKGAVELVQNLNKSLLINLALIFSCPLRINLP
jgi:hypothetical protein